MTYKLCKLTKCRRYICPLAVTAVGIAGLLFYRWPPSNFSVNLPSEYPYKVYSEKKPIDSKQIPSRVDSLTRLKSGEEFDLLVIGGGCTGSGVALDAVTRGLKVALIEKNDFSSGTSSRSTKLIHGGVRYLEKAFKNLDMGQLNLVTDALNERKHLLSISPNLSHEIPIIVPLYHKFPEILFYAPYFWVGMKLYDWFSRSSGALKASYFMRKKEVTEKFPMINDKGLKGAIVYYDGMHNDARMNICIALTAAHKGAAVTNHVEIIDFQKDLRGKIRGAVLKDNITGDTFEIKCKSVVNATGCFADEIRRKDDINVENIIVPSAGVHVVLPSGYSPKHIGLLIPNTDDGRVLFLLPWEGSTIAGTTDSSCKINELPSPTTKEVTFILKELQKYLNKDLDIKDINASWSGIRPLAKTSVLAKTSAISRDHLIEVSESELITISGGKWTTYRKMSEDVVDRLLEINKDLNPTSRKCVTKEIPLVGASGWSLSLKSDLIQKGYSEDIAEHLSHNYGYLAYEIANIGLEKGFDKILAKGYPFIEAEVLFGIRHEQAMTLVDVIARRVRLAFLNSEVALQTLPRVLEIMSEEKKWDAKKRVEEYNNAVVFLDTMNVQTEKRHAWRSNKNATDSVKNIEMAFGECPLAEHDIRMLLEYFKGNDELISPKSFVAAIEDQTIKNSDIRNYIPELKESLCKRNKNLMKTEDLLFALSGVIIMKE